ncbi:olfactory receptor 14J1-like [Tachyglossus aculeatus]|uniref:olfactory receptor 14J1-like n=1 Tax=Tachyglossus aculeatus TaxID=9261 RepID=UPI0018F45B3F|nr:olfactory receptor 14J1-like [Tachyglossus aculeatus]
MGFLLLGFSEVPELQLVHATLFLLVYVVDLIGNLIIIAAATLDRLLHTPIEISFLYCVFQFLLLLLFAFSELYFLIAMSFDHHHLPPPELRGHHGPRSLRYDGGRLLVGWYQSATMHAAATFSVGFGASNYVHIFQAVLRMSAAKGRAKAFCTCLPHLAIVISLISMGTVTHLQPPSDSSSTLDLLVSMFYTVMPPALNPLIYSLRTRAMKAALRRVLEDGSEKQGHMKFILGILYPFNIKW